MTKKCEHPKRVLVTGAAGHIGRPVCRALIDRGHVVRGFDRVEGSLPGVDDFRVAELTDAAAVAEACAGMDTVVHLAANPNDDDFMEELLPSNIIGVYHVFNGAKKAGVGRMIATSSVQAASGLGGGGKLVRVEDGTLPLNHYAVTKVFLEAMGKMYAVTHGMSVVIVRPGGMPHGPLDRDPKEVSESERNTYLSPADSGRLFTRAVESEKPGRSEFAIVFALSRGDWTKGYDREPARRVLGYEAQHTFAQGYPGHFD